MISTSFKCKHSKSSRCTNKNRKKKLSICSVAVLFGVEVSGFGAFQLVQKGSYSPIHSCLRYQVSDDNVIDGDRLAERQRVNVNHNFIGFWFNGFFKPKPEKDDFEKYVDFLGHRYSRLKNFDGVPTDKTVTDLGLDDVHNKYKARQGIMSFNFKEASTALDTTVVNSSVSSGSRKVSQVICNAQSNLPSNTVPPVADFGSRLAFVSSLVLKQLQVIRKYQKAAVDQITSVITTVIAFLFRPTTASLAFSCALIMYKPLKGVALAIAAVSQEA